MKAEIQVKLNRFLPRDYQKPILDALNRGIKRVLCIMPRRSGKDIVAFNYCIRKLLEKPCVIYYVFPTYAQGKKVLWDSLNNEGKRILDYIPSEVIDSTNSQEMKVRFINGSLFQVVGSDNFDCFDDRTEILTNNGWKFFKDLDPFDAVATYKDGFLHWEIPKKYVEYDYDGELYGISNSSLDFRVTPNHRFYVVSSRGKGKFKEISDPTIRHDKIPAQCDYYLNNIDLKHWEFYQIGETLYESKWFVALLGIFLSEGSTFSNSKCYRVTISQIKPIVRKKIAELLDNLNIKYLETQNGFNIENKDLYKYFSMFGLQHERFIPEDIKRCFPGAYLKILLDWLILGDGYSSKVYTAYYSTSKKLIDDVQEIIIKLRLSGNIHIKKQKASIIKGRIINSKKTLYEIRIRKSRYKRLQGADSKPYIQKYPYKGKVYCVSTKSGIIKVRRNGKECWSGNSLMGTNPSGVVFSEYALQDPRAYQYLRPILTANNGWALFISCVAPNTLVITQNGLKYIKNVSSNRNEYSDLNESIWGLGGFNNAEQFYYGGLQKTLKIALESGFELECTPIHPIWNGRDWIKAQDLKIGDLLPIQYGQDVWGPGLDISDFYYEGRLSSVKNINIDVSSEDFFYLLGLIHGDGNYNKNTICVTNKKDPEIIDFLHKYGFRTRTDGIHHELSSRIMVQILEYLEFKHGARNKDFPEPLFECSKIEMRAFLQGIFDTDGTSNSNASKRGNIKFTSTCLEFIKKLQIVLLNFGVVSSIYFEDKAPNIKVKVWSRIYNLEICGYFAYIFYRDIGFRLTRKQKNSQYIVERCKEESGNIYPVDLSYRELPSGLITNRSKVTRRILYKLNQMRPGDKYIESLLSEKLFYSPIKEIIDSENEVFDFVIPQTNSFFSNGFLSHNTPRGKNHLWELFQIAQQSENWFAYKLTLHDTQHIPLYEIEKERAEGIMSDDLIAQEYYCDFSMGVEGAFYAKYIDKLRLDNRIGDVPWESSFKVFTCWDLGVRDATSIIFYQVIGQSIRIIDCYENSKQGLEHYVKILESKPYLYSKHIAPHDIKVQEFGSGITRIEKARQLGIKFVVAPDVSIPDGIEAVRSCFSKIWIDERNCKGLIKALENYRQEFDIKKRVYKSQPLHNWASHFADSMRYLAISLPKTKDGLTSDDIDRNYNESRYGQNYNQPSFFRDDLPNY